MEAISTLLRDVQEVYVQKGAVGIIVASPHWCIYEPQAAAAIVAKITPPDLVTQEGRSMVFRRLTGAKWKLVHKRGDDLRRPRDEFIAAAEAGQVLDLEDLGIVLRDRFAGQWRDLVLLSDGEGFRFAFRDHFDALAELFPGAGLAGEKQWHDTQARPIVFHDFGSILAALSPTVYTGTATRFIYPDPRRRFRPAKLAAG